MFRYILIASLIISLSVSTAFAQKLTQPPRTTRGTTFALLIGVNTYPNSEDNLNFCVRDAQVLARTFEEIGIPKKNIILMIDGAKQEWEPTRSNIRTQIKLVTDLVTEDDLVIISFAGHGVQIDMESYLCPRDMNHLDPETLIKRKWIKDTLVKCRARKKLFLIDACRNELNIPKQRALNKTRSISDPLKDLDSRGFALITSCEHGQFSYEDTKTLKQGIFSYYVARGLKGKADENGDKRVTFEELYRYVLDNTRNHAREHYKAAQVPMRGGEYSGDFVLAMIPKSPPPPSLLPPPPPPSPSPPSPVDNRNVRKIKNLEYAFRWCPAGVFIMGSPKNEAKRQDIETQHRVTITRGFWMLETEVTQGMWKSIMGDTPSGFKGAKYPVEQVSWNDCQRFIQRLNSLSNAAPQGYKFALPTEAQWEYACRAGTTTPFHFGSELNGDKANCNGTSPYGTSRGGKDLRRTTYVGTYPPNNWGLYDMHGNVYEWCSDWFGDYPSGPITNPVGPTTGANRVNRGGSWFGDAKLCRSAYRGSGKPSNRINYVGFRIVLVRAILKTGTN